MDPSCHLSCSQVATLNASFILSCSFHLNAPWTHLGLLHLVSELDGSCCHLSCFQVATLNASFILSCSLHLDPPWTHLGLLHLASELDGSKLPCIVVFMARFPLLLLKQPVVSTAWIPTPDTSSASISGEDRCNC